MLGAPSASASSLKVASPSSFSYCFLSRNDPINFSSSPSPYLKPHSVKPFKRTTNSFNHSFRLSYRFSAVEDDEGTGDNFSFDEAVTLFNDSEYYKCHDLLEALWNRAQEPTRTLIHGILQCAVGFHHLFNQNHRGAMMHLGEGLCKLRKMNFESGPFHQFEQEISAALGFIYQTQIEFSCIEADLIDTKQMDWRYSFYISPILAGIDDLCLAMDQSERSYQLLGGYGAGQHLYSLKTDLDQITYIVFYPQTSYGDSRPPKAKLPLLNATKEHLVAFEYK